MLSIIKKGKALQIASTLKKEQKDIKDVLKKLGISARELMRTTEDEYKTLNLKDEKDEEKLIEAMVSHPKLIQRAIVIKGDKAVLGRPPEKVLELF